ncbi:EAL domain-containing protein [Acidimicrobiia bacterium EGI L10123]|uniref:sensor domain-containing protein n=1 Tax=Salinilacustrithrix flava TaxID=2957203 RepID=UPI003D7C2413|nr:EAL domain-containing protein [Acidimicrobiia bacterium EGI L10123]
MTASGATGRPGHSDTYVEHFLSDLPDAALAVDSSGRIVAANELVHQLLGFADGALEGASIEELVPDDARAQHAGRRRAFQAQPSARHMGGGLILRARRADGIELPVSISLAPLDDAITVAIVHDRTMAVHALQEVQDRLEVEMLAASIASSLAGATGGELDLAIDAGLHEICERLLADQALLYVTSDDGERLELTNEWCAPDLDPTTGRIVSLPRAPFGWAAPKLQRGEAVYVPRPDDLPATAGAEAAFMVEHGIRSALTIPLGAREDYEGTFSLRWRREPAPWDESRTDMVRLLGNVFLAAHRRRQAESIRDASEARHKSLVDTLAAGVVLVRRGDGCVVSANPSAARILGFADGDLVGTDLLSNDVGLVSRDGSPVSAEQRRRLLATEPDDTTLDLGYRRADGTMVWIEVRSVRLVLGGEEHLAVSFIDVTDRRDAEALLVARAMHDPLTGLPNRLLLGEHTRATLARAGRNGSTTALLFFDLDRFKRINDRYGHATGDALLTGVAHRVQAELRAGDLFARIGGDEFVAVLSELGDEAEAGVLAERLQAALTRPVQVDGVEHQVSASIGLATASADEAGALTVDDLLRRADRAMYAAKRSGRARWVTWTDALVSAAQHREELEVELHQSLLAGDFTLRYQPVLDLSSGGLVGAEALVRWNHPRRGMLEPAEFLDVAEDTGLIVPLGQWVLEEACATAMSWPEHLWIAVNLSARQIGSNDAASRVRRVLEDTGLDPGRLHLELTETALIEGSHSAIGDITALRELGAAIGLDDFGTGYSSMTYLHTLPLTFLKIDRSFVSELDDPAAHRATTIVDMVLRLAERFELEVIAEGVETDVQASRLRGLGCRFVQGFLYAPPLSADELARRIAADQPA